MAKVSANISIDADTKAKAQALLSDFGMDLSTAVNIFLKQMIYEGAIPFTISRNMPNPVTVSAMKEAQDIAKFPEKYKKYNDLDEMIGDILSEV